MNHVTQSAAAKVSHCEVESLKSDIVDRESFVSITRKNNVTLSRNMSCFVFLSQTCLSQFHRLIGSWKASHIVIQQNVFCCCCVGSLCFKRMQFEL